MRTSTTSIRLLVLAAGMGLLLAGCTSGTTGTASESTGSTAAASSAAAATPVASASASGEPNAEVNRTIRIGLEDIGSSAVVAEVYARALRDAGFDVALTVPSTPQVFIEAMQKGQVDLLPTYSGLFADSLFSAGNGPGAVRSVTTDVPSTLAYANELAAPFGIDVLDAAPAAEDIVFVVTREFAEANGIRTLSDLALYSRLKEPIRLGGLASCDTAAFCKPNLEKTYQMRFKEFVPLTADGTIVKSALDQGSIEVGFVPATDPALASRELVVLEEDIPLKLVTNIAPAVRRAFATPEVVTVLDAVSSNLTSEDLGAMVQAVEVQGEPVGRVAGEFVAAKGLGRGLYDKPTPVVEVVIPRTVDTSAPTASATQAAAGGPLRISFAPFFDTEIAARIYAAALASAGIDVSVGDAQEPEDLFAQLPTGEVQFAPIRLNALASYLTSLEKGPLALPVTTRNAAELVKTARDYALQRGVAILQPTEANVGSAFVVSDQYAALTGVKTLSDLAGASRALPVKLGGPPSCPNESWCQPFLEDVYGVQAESFTPLDFGGALSRGAIANGDVDVAWLSANDGGIDTFGFTVLKDDLGREPINPIAPALSQTAVSPDIARIVNRVSAALTTQDLQEMNRRVEFEREEMNDVVQEFIKDKGLDDIPLAERTAG